MSTNDFLKTIEAARVRFNSGDVEGYVTTLYAPDCTFHYFPPGMPGGWEGAKMYYGGFKAAFPNANFAPEDILTDGDKVAIRYRLRATHLGEFNGMLPTGRTAVLNGITILRFANGKVVERWNEADFLGFLQQLGAMPQPEMA